MPALSSADLQQPCFCPCSALQPMQEPSECCVQPNNPIKGLFFLGYVDPGAPPTTVQTFEACPAPLSCCSHANLAHGNQRLSRFKRPRSCLWLCVQSTLNATNATWTLVELGQTAHAFTGGGGRFSSMLITPVLRCCRALTTR